MGDVPPARPRGAAPLPPPLYGFLPPTTTCLLAVIQILAGPPLGVLYVISISSTYRLFLGLQILYGTVTLTQLDVGKIPADVLS